MQKREYEVVIATCKVSIHLEVFTGINDNLDIVDKKMYILGKVKTVEQFIQLWTEFTKVNVLQQLSSITNVTWTIKQVDTSNNIHNLYCKVASILHEYINQLLIKMHPKRANITNVNNTVHKHCLIIEILNEGKILCTSILNMGPFLQ